MSDHREIMQDALNRNQYDERAYMKATPETAKAKITVEVKTDSQ